MECQEISIRLYKKSLERITKTAPQFLNRFYYHFMGIGPVVALMFRGRNMERIKRKLMTTMELVADKVDQVPGTIMYLELLGRIHNRRQVTIDLLRAWRNALISTVSECDPEFDENIRLSWLEVLDSVIAEMYKYDIRDKSSS